MRKWLLKQIENRKMSQRMLAKRLGVSSQSVSLIIHGRRQKEMSLSLMIKFSKIFNVPIRAIFEAENAYQKQKNKDTLEKEKGD